MAAFKELKLLADRKGQLLLESQIHRQMTTLELEMLKFRLGRAGGGLQALPQIWRVALPVAGFLLATRLKWGSWFFTKGTFKLMALFKAFRIVQRIFKT